MHCITNKFLANIYSFSERIVSGTTLRQSRSCFLDYIGCLVSGLRVYDDCLNYGNSSLRLGMAAHVLELDDGHRKGAVHVGATVFSALLAVAQKESIDSRDFLLGAIMGYEATIRLACAVQPGNKLRGYHATGTCGTVGAALGIAAALHYTKEQMNTTLAAAVTSAAGVLEMQEDDSDLKPYNVGRAAMDAVAAAAIGRTGLKGPKDALGGKRGFLAVMTDEPHVEYLTDFDEYQLCIEQVYQKVYAACRHAHPAIEAALALRDKIKIDEILKIEVRAYKLAVAGHDHTDIAGISSAKMSIPFGVSVALITGGAGLDAYSERNVADSSILALTKKVSVVEDAELTSMSPAKRASMVTIVTSTGKYTKRVDYPKGEPENPLTDEELIQKFNSLVIASGLSESNCNKVIELINQPAFSILELLESLHLHTLYNKATN